MSSNYFEIPSTLDENFDSNQVTEKKQVNSKQILFTFKILSKWLRIFKFTEIIPY